MAPFQLLIIFVLDGLRDDLSDIPREDILNLDASVVASRFCEWVQNEIDIFITHGNYQANPHLFPWFSAVCANTVGKKNPFSFVRIE